MRWVMAFVLALGGCAALPPPARCPASGLVPAIWLMDRGWHAELLVPASAIDGPLAAAARRFPGAPLIAFGFGKRDWITAEEQDIGTILAGPIPGPGVIEVTGRASLPERAIQLGLDGAGMAGLVRFLTASLADPAALPAVTSRYGQHFHDASQRYSLGYTCNTWVAEALAAAGLTVRAAGVVRTRGVLRQVATLPQACLG